MVQSPGLRKLDHGDQFWRLNWALFRSVLSQRQNACESPGSSEGTNLEFRVVTLRSAQSHDPGAPAESTQSIAPRRDSATAILVLREPRAYPLLAWLLESSLDRLNLDQAADTVSGGLIAAHYGGPMDSFPQEPFPLG